jgi:anthranilate phosphoribosyltransferase
MSNIFRDLLRKVGSGNHTSESLTRAEAASATRMMLQAEATPAQIGAFMIAHRIKRPTGEELAGMLDAYNQLGPKLQPIASNRRVIVLGIPYDGRSRSAPISPITTLLLAAAGQPVVMHGSDRRPTKYGLPLVEVWQGLGIDWTQISLPTLQQVFEQTGIGLVYTNKHFPLTNSIWEYRDQIGKRPPFATMELIWCPYAGDAHIITGYVHPPTEAMFETALRMHQVKQFTTIKGLEGSCDLPRDRTAIIGLSSQDTSQSSGIERLHLVPREYGFNNQNVPLETTSALVAEIQATLAGKPGELMQSALWNGGFYLWRSGVSLNMDAGITKAKELITSGAAAQKLQEISSLLTVSHVCQPV